MIRDSLVTEKRNLDGTLRTKAYKQTSVILHSYILERDSKTKTWKYSEDERLNLNDGFRHRTRSFVIAHDDVPHPNVTKLKELLVIPTTDHSNVKTASDYGSKLGGFCPDCLAKVKSECKKKFGGNW